MLIGNVECIRFIESEGSYFKFLFKEHDNLSLNFGDEVNSDGKFVLISESLSEEAFLHIEESVVNPWLIFDLYEK
jgi:hypothetical protein